MNMLVSTLALLVERRWGYPTPLLDAIGHPVMWFGRLIDSLETRLNRPDQSPEHRRRGGIIGLAALLITVLVVTVLIRDLTNRIPHGWIIEIVLATSLLAQKELGRSVRAVAEALRQSLPAGREAVSQIVGRDPQALDEAGVARAAVETLAESTSDGVIAPLFFLALFGLPGIALYKAVNTADSMIGHLNARYRDYGWASAKLDDVLNWIPARLTLVLITIACFFAPGASPGKAWAIAQRDARKHESPNAGWPEAAFAGALGFKLGGPRAYDGEVVDLPAFGDGRAELRPADILLALELYNRTLTVLVCFCGAIAVMQLISA